MSRFGPSRKSRELFCGWIDDGGDQVDYQMARSHLARQFGPLQLGAEFERRSAVRAEPLGTR
jgi:hypothetical protein